jgi:predicted permease
MRRLRSWLLRVLSVVGLGRSDAEINEELRAHRDLLAAEYLRSGVSANDARRRAAADLGSETAAADRYRDQRGAPALEHAIRDLRMAARSLARTPGLSAAMVLVLGLGIGSSTAIVAVFHAIVWAGLPVQAPEAVVRIYKRGDSVDRRVQGNVTRFSYPELIAYRESTQALSAVAGVTDARVNWRLDGQHRDLQAALVAGDYFKVLPVQPARGRLLSPEDARAAVAVISYELWVTAFAEADDVLGRTMRLDGAMYAIVGVAPRAFAGSELEEVALWLPLEARTIGRGDEKALSSRNLGWIQILGRLAPGASVAAARSEAGRIAAQVQANESERGTIGVRQASRLDIGAAEHPAGRAAFQTVSGVVVGVLVVLLFICGSNAAALLLARGAAREKEIAVRLALGASRWQVVRQLAAEVSVIAIAGAGVGVVVCFAALQALAAVVPIREVLLTIRPDARVFGFVFLVAFALAGLFGLSPARQALAVDCLGGLKDTGRAGGAGPRALGLRRMIVAVQVAASLVLLVIASLLARGVSHAWTIDPGFRTSGMHVIELRNEDDQQIGTSALAEQLTQAVRALPGVIAVSRISRPPFAGSWTSQAASSANGPRERVHFSLVDEQYFATLSVPLVAGHAFQPLESDAVMINAALARRLWGDERSAIGRTLFVPPNTGGDRLLPKRVVGVSPTLLATTPGVPDEPTYHELIAADEQRTPFLLVRANDGALVSQVVSDRARAIDPDAFVVVGDLDRRLGELVSPMRVGVAIVGLIGLLALIVAAVGIHGVIAYTVACRTRDIGLYQALGAGKARVLRLVIGWTLRGVIIGVAAALVLLCTAAVLLRPQARAVLNGLDPLDPVAFAAATAALTVVVGTAAYLPARWALGLTPLAALRRD